jgi:hypothetical protein
LEYQKKVGPLLYTYSTWVVVDFETASRCCFGGFMAIDIVTVDFFKGRREILAFAIKDEDGVAYNLTGYSAEASIRQQVGGTELRVLDSFITLTNGTTTYQATPTETFTYNVLVDISGAETNLWTFGEAFTDVIVIQPNGEVLEFVRFFLKQVGTYT